MGWPGSVHDSRVLRNSSLCATAANKFPGDTHLLGDGGYPLKRFGPTKKSLPPPKYIHPNAKKRNISRWHKFHYSLSKDCHIASVAVLMV